MVLLGVTFLATSGGVPGRSYSGTPARITIDAGHGGYDPGAIVSGISEKTVNLQIALKIREIGAKHPTLDLHFTRTSDDYISLIRRLEVAEGNGSDAYISIQANSFHDPSVSGVETLLDGQRRRSSSSWAMAESVQQAIVDRTGARDRGIRRQRLYTRYTSMPSALVEVGFLSSPSERSRLIRTDYQEAIARGVIQGLLVHFSR